MIYNKTKLNKKSAFSLAEVLVSLLIISVILLLALPVITKKNIFANNSLKGGSKVFLFQEQSEDDANFPCYITTLDAAGNTTVVKDTNGKCQRYTFSVPNDVYKLNITLVAGGGGGGGAAGGTVLRKEYTSNATSPLKMLHSRLQKFVIDALVSNGEDGHKRSTASSANIQAGKGGSSGNAIVNHKLPVDFIALDFEPDFLTEVANANSIMTMKFGNEEELKNITSQIAKVCPPNDTWCKLLGIGRVEQNLYNGIEQFNGFGIFFDSDKKVDIEAGSIWDAVLADQDSKQKAGIFLGDAAEGKRIQVYTTKLEDNDGVFEWNSESDNRASAIGAQDIDVLPNDSELVTSMAKLNNFSFLPSIEGKESYLGQTGKVTSGYIVAGGEGGKINILGTYGAGGRGEGAMVVCQDKVFECDTPNNDQVDDGQGTHHKIRTIAGEKDMENAYGKISAYIDNPGGSGGGGAGGSAIKINNFPVIPGSKYTIVVGSGGAGGAGGKSGLINGTTNSYETKPQEGQDGIGGSSSAIYDEEGNLVLLVIGGVGGYGGTINTAAETTPSGNDLSNYAPLPSAPKSARNVPIVLSSDNAIFNKIIPLLDKKIVSSLEVLGSSTPNDILAGYQARRIVNRFMTYDNDNSRISPYFELNTNSSNVSLGTAVAKTSATNDDKTGGFSSFDYNATRSIDALSRKPNNSYNGLDNSKDVYAGLYFRSILDNYYSYSGGLGGFSGLGTKAGCGGLFVGNNTGLLVDGTFNNAYKNTFILNTKESGQNFRAFNIGNYYGSCTISNSNGQTAEFVAPSYVPSAGEKLGSAGSGGGGGGYNSKYGAGNGGDGQNGYVMINWRY